MTTFEDLCSVAYKTERVASRRAMKNSGISETEALKKILEKAADKQSLSELVRTRRQIKLDELARIKNRKQEKAEVFAKKLVERQPDSKSWLAWFDGSTHPNPGKMGIGALLKNPDGNTIEISFAAGQGDSNVAEYLALIAVLEEAVRNQPKKLVIYGDSQIIINEVNNADKAGAFCLQDYRQRALQLMEQLTAVTLTWIPRKKNTAADALSQQAVATTNSQIFND